MTPRDNRERSDDEDAFDITSTIAERQSDEGSSEMYRIHTSQLVADIRSGIGDAALMSKYDLSQKLFQRLLQRLVDEKVVGHQDLYQWSPMYKHISDVFASRRQPRTYVPIAVRVLHNGGSQQGFIRDISEIGLRTAGIQAEVGEASDALHAADGTTRHWIDQSKGCLPMVRKKRPTHEIPGERV